MVTGGLPRPALMAELITDELLTSAGRHSIKCEGKSSGKLLRTIVVDSSLYDLLHTKVTQYNHDLIKKIKLSTTFVVLSQYSDFFQDIKYPEARIKLV